MSLENWIRILVLEAPKTVLTPSVTVKASEDCVSQEGGPQQTQHLPVC